MNRDEIIEAEVEKAEQRYQDRRSAFVMNRFHRVVDPRGVDPETNMTHFQMDLAEIAELYRFDPATGEYLINAGGWCAPIDTTWSLPDGIFDATSSWLNIKPGIEDPRFV